MLYDSDWYWNSLKKAPVLRTGNGPVIERVVFPEVGPLPVAQLVAASGGGHWKWWRGSSTEGWWQDQGELCGKMMYNWCLWSVTLPDVRKQSGAWWNLENIRLEYLVGGPSTVWEVGNLACRNIQHFIWRVCNLNFFATMWSTEVFCFVALPLLKMNFPMA